MKILIINGPNLNLLGSREKNIYGENSYLDLISTIKSHGEKYSTELEFFQSNIEGEIINEIQRADHNFDGIIINPGAYTHYSVAILDAIRSISVPVIEVHISNINQREDFRKKSVTAEGCIGQISGLGFTSYILALDYFIYNNQRDN